MDKKKDTPAEVETVTVTMSRPVAEAVQTACEMYLRLHMGQFNDLAEDLCMAKHYADMDQDRRAELCLCSCGCSRHEGPLEGLIRRQSRRKTI